MSMSIEFNPGVLELKISQIGERAMKGMSARMRQHAVRIRDLAREYAPVKTGKLESSIDYETIREGRRNAYVVFIDVDAMRDNGKGQVGDYAYIMEEELHPYGRQKGKLYFRLGEKSKTKAATGKRVGGRFLARAIRDGTKDVFKDMVSEVRRVTGGSTLGSSYVRDIGGNE